MELRGDGTGNFKHFIKNAKKRAKDYPFRPSFSSCPSRLSGCGGGGAGGGVEVCNL
jgi:hypothetical protein